MPKFVGEIIEEKNKKIVDLSKCKLVNKITGEIISDDLSPKFENWGIDDFRDRIDNPAFGFYRFISPMLCSEPDSYGTSENKIAELKFDGHRCLFHIGEGVNRVFSKRISTVTGWYSENTDRVPHLRDFDLSHLNGTILDGEILWGNTSSDVSKVLGSLSPLAVIKQVEAGEFAKLIVWDILYYKGMRIKGLSLFKRKNLLHKAVSDIKDGLIRKYILCSDIYATHDLGKEAKFNYTVVKSFESLFNQFVEDGREGIMVKDLDGKYKSGRVSRQNMKVKKKRTYDVVFMGTTEPTKEYTGKCLDTWEYFEGNTPVTKPYYMGWCGGIRFGIYDKGKLKEIGIAKGLTEEIMEDIKNNDFAGRVFEVEAQEILESGKLRHPRFFRWRDDKAPKQCNFDSFYA